MALGEELAWTSATELAAGELSPVEVVDAAIARIEARNPSLNASCTYPLNFTGHPAASVPAGLADCLPVGMQVVGRRYADVDVLAASAAFEALRPWAGTYAVPAGRPLEAPA